MRGSKRRRSKDTWELQAYDGRKKRYKYKTVRATSGREATKLLNAFVAEVDGGRAPERPARLTLGTVCDEWFATKAVQGTEDVRAVRLGTLSREARARRHGDPCGGLTRPRGLLPAA